MDHARMNTIAVAVLLLLSCLMMLPGLRTGYAVTWTVGDDAGWSYNVSTWADDKHIKVGDILVFNYDPMAHNVVYENSDGYDTCVVLSDAKIYQTGHDSIELKKVGVNDFISGVFNDCEKGMKLEVYAHLD